MSIFGGGGNNPEEDPTSLRSTSFMEIVEVVSEGEIEGFANATPEESIYFDLTPLKVGATWNFGEIGVEFTTGTKTQGYLTQKLNEGTSSPRPVDSLVRNDLGGVVRQTQNPDVDKVRVTVSLPALVRTDSTGDIRGTTVQIKIEIQASGEPAYVEVDLAGRDVISGKTTSTYQRSYLIPLLQYGSAPYNIRVTRVTPDSESAKINDTVYWSSFDEIVSDKLTYPHSAIIKTLFDAQKFNSIPNRGYLLKGIKCEVPVNYDPVAHTYSGNWDGSFKTAWTNNPAWVFYDILTKVRYGLGDLVTSDMVDKAVLYQIGQYCDEQVDTGYGSTEPRFTCNVYMQTAEDAIKVLQDLASVFRGIIYYTNGLISPVTDRDSTPVAQFTAANVIDGLFSYSSTPRHARTTVALVKWNDPANGYKSEIEYVEDPQSIERWGVIESSVVAFGCLSRGQAHRAGKYVLLTNQQEADTVTFRVGLDGMTVMPGNVIKVIDPIKSSAIASGGRLPAVAGSNAVTLDRDITLNGGVAYTLTLMQPDGTLVEAPVSSVAGSYPAGTSISLGHSFAPGDEPMEGSVWTLTRDDATPALWRVLSIAESKGDADGFYEVTAARYSEFKHLNVDTVDDLGELTPPTVDYGGISPASALNLFVGVYVVDNVLRRYIEGSWFPSPGPYLSHYLVDWRKPDATTERFTTTTPSFRINDPALGQHSFTVYAIDIAGKFSTPLAGSVLIDVIPPVETVLVTGLELAGQGNDTNFTGRDPTFEWRLTSLINYELGDEELGGDTGNADPWLQDYEIRIYVAGVLVRVDHTEIPSYTYFYTKNVEDGGPNRTFTIEVAARDIYNRTGIPAQLTVTNPPPTEFKELQIRTGFEQILIGYFPPDDPDYVATRVYLSDTSGFTPSQENLVYEGNDLTIIIPGIIDGVYYLKLEGVDAFGPAEVFSSEFYVNMQSVESIHREIAGRITESWLYQTLNDRIDLIDGYGPGSVNERISEIEITGVTTFFQPTPPAAAEASDGDLWFDTNDSNHPYRFNGATQNWDDIRDTANTGITTFYTDGPTGPIGASSGDLWFDTADDNHPYWYDGAVWRDIRDGLVVQTASDVLTLITRVDDVETTNTAQAALIQDHETRVTTVEGELVAQASDITTLQSSVNTKSSVWYQAADPVTTGESPIHGDIWIDIDNQNKPWVWDSSIPGWGDGSDLATAGNKTFYQPNMPNPDGIVSKPGDLWIETDNNNKLWRLSDALVWEDARDTSASGTTTYYTTEPNFVNWPSGVEGDLLFVAYDYDQDGLADNLPFRWTSGGWISIPANGLVASIQQELNTLATTDGFLSASYVLKLDVNGHIAGIGISVDNTDPQNPVPGPIESEMILQADRFAVAKPAGYFYTGMILAVNNYVRPSEAFFAANPSHPKNLVYRVYFVNAPGATGAEPNWPTALNNTTVSGQVFFISEEDTALIPFIIDLVDGVPTVVMSRTMIADASITKADIDVATIDVLDALIIYAHQINTGTIDVGPSGYIRLGGPNFELKSDPESLRITDDQAVPVERVYIGRLGPNPEDFGIVIRDAAGDVILSSGTGLNFSSGTLPWENVTGANKPKDLLVNPGVWQIGTNFPMGMFTEWVPDTGQNSIVTGTTPEGKKAPVWRCISDGAASGYDGGFLTQPEFPIDPLRTYRFSVWFQFVGNVVNAGNLYFGPTTGGSIEDARTGVVNTNPYFLSHPVSTFATNQWYLAIGYVFPHNYTAGADFGAVYDGITGAKVVDLGDYRWESAAITSAFMRAGWWYSTENFATNRAYFFGPRVDLMDGNEPSISALLGVADKTSENVAAGITGQGNFATLDQITAANISTYIAGAAIENAYIGDVIQSASFVPSQGVGWKLDKQGQLEAAQLTVYDRYGNIVLRSGSTTPQTGAVIKVAADENLVENGDLSFGSSSWHLAEGNTTFSPQVGWIGEAQGTIRYLLMPNWAGTAYAWGSNTFKVTPGRQYRIKFRAYSPGASGTVNGFYARLFYSLEYTEELTLSNRTGFVEFINGGNSVLDQTPRDYEYDWVCPSSVFWACFAVYNWSQSSADFNITQISVTPFGAAAEWNATNGADWNSNLQNRPSGIYNNDFLTQLGMNPTFSDWPTGTYPTGWGAWSGGVPTRFPIALVGPYSVQFITDGVNQKGIVSTKYFAGPLGVGEYIAVSFSYYLFSHNPAYGDPGILIDVLDSGSYKRLPVPIPSKTIGTWHTMSVVVDARAGWQATGLRIYLMGSWAGMTGTVAGVSLCNVLIDNLQATPVGAGDNTAANPQPYSWVTGTKPPTNADNTAASPQSPGWLTSGVVWVNNKISSVNIGTYMSSAAIQQAYIGNLQVGTLQIQDNAVTVPRYVNGPDAHMNASYQLTYTPTLHVLCTTPIWNCSGAPIHVSAYFTLFPTTVGTTKSFYEFIVDLQVYYSGIPGNVWTSVWSPGTIALQWDTFANGGGDFDKHNVFSLGRTYLPGAARNQIRFRLVGRKITTSPLWNCYHEFSHILAMEVKK